MGRMVAADAMWRQDPDRIFACPQKKARCRAGCCDDAEAGGMDADGVVYLGGDVDDTVPVGRLVTSEARLKRRTKREASAAKAEVAVQ